MSKKASSPTRNSFFSFMTCAVSRNAKGHATGG
jgi:hypothetical protein